MFHVTDEETQPLRDQETWLRSHGQLRDEAGLGYSGLGPICRAQAYGSGVMKREFGARSDLSLRFATHSCITSSQ